MSGVLYNLNSLDRLIIREFMNEDDKSVMLPSPSTSQMKIMEYIIKHRGEDIYQKDLEDVLQLRRATVSGVLKTMEKHHLIERVVTKDDVRCKKIILNKDAKKIFEEKRKQFLKIEKILLANLTNEEISNFSLTIDKMKKNIIEYKERK